MHKVVIKVRSVAVAERLKKLAEEEIAKERGAAAARRFNAGHRARACWRDTLKRLAWAFYGVAAVFGLAFWGAITGG